MKFLDLNIVLLCDVRFGYVRDLICEFSILIFGNCRWFNVFDDFGIFSYC